MREQTIQNEAVLEGVGLHSGKRARVVLKPGKAAEGIIFRRIDLPGKPCIKLCLQNVILDKSVSRCTIIGTKDANVSTVEHLLAAVHALEIDNMVVDIDAEEMPGLDGSSIEYLRAIKGAGVVLQDSHKEVIAVKSPITISQGESSITILPAHDFKVSYTLDYHHPALPLQTFSSVVNPTVFEEAIAPSRTFCLEDEIDQIKAAGLGKGANEHNTLVMGIHGPRNNKLRFADECARHKVLDIVGDLFLAGKRIVGHVYAVKSGHALNRQLVEKIMERVMSEKVYDINDIIKVLPHRYPFLLVDRVTVTETGKKGFGIKNVTINDGFFAGHFPQRPVMPGVLMVEAMAQTTGVILLTSGLHPNKVALFMSLDEVKFRKIVQPGDQLVMEVEIVRDRERTAQVKGIGKVGNEIAVEAMMVLSYADVSTINL